MYDTKVKHCDDRVLLVLFVIIMLHSCLNCLQNIIIKNLMSMPEIYPTDLCDSKSFSAAKISKIFFHVLKVNSFIKQLE